MDARLQFEWNGDKARRCVNNIFGDKELTGTGEFDDIVNRNDADYEVKLTVTLKHKRKSRAKKTED